MRGIEIGKGLIMAMRAPEMKVTSNTKLTAPRAKLRAICWSNPDDRYSSFSCFVADEILEFGKSPRMMEVSLPFPDSGSLSNVGEGLQSDSHRPLLCLFNYPFAYIMKHPAQDTVFPSANSFKSSSGRTGALELKLPSYLGIMPSYMFCFLTFEVKPGGAGSQIASANIYTNNTDWFDWLNFLLYGKTEINFSLPHIKNDLSLSLLPLRILLVIATEMNRQVKSTINCQNRAPILFNLKGSAVKMKRVTVKPKELVVSFPVAISPAYLSYRLTDQPCWERTFYSDFSVGETIELISAESSSGEGNLSSSVQGLIIGFKGAKEDKPIIRGGFKFDFYGFSNQHSYIVAG